MSLELARTMLTSTLATAIEMRVPHSCSSALDTRPSLVTSQTSTRSGLAMTSEVVSGAVNEVTRRLSMMGVGVSAWALVIATAISRVREPTDAMYSISKRRRRLCSGCDQDDPVMVPLSMTLRIRSIGFECPRDEVTG